ncbi:MAG: ImmA/IrrE family metallo-endopeptidase [Lachnospiraceae bacterium]|nr:ImmA/IrrE family metallo-endopeptidase [Lachnospiraceae bacterium]
MQEKHQLKLDNNVYELAQVGIPNDIPKVTDWDTQDSIGKDIVRYSIDKDNDIVCPEPDKPTPNPSGILLPLNDKSFYDVPLEKIVLWKETYPAVDIEQELKRMIAWLDSNPTRRKTKRGIASFINRWLSKEQDSGKTYQQAGRSQDTGQPVPKGGKHPYLGTIEDFNYNLAHELAHYFLHYDKGDIVESDKNKEYEEQADRAADKERRYSHVSKDKSII